jgi:hypothetical protein
MAATNKTRWNPQSRANASLDAGAAVWAARRHPRNVVHIAMWVGPLRCRRRLLRDGRQSGQVDCPQLPAWHEMGREPESRGAAGHAARDRLLSAWRVRGPAVAGAQRAARGRSHFVLSAQYAHRAGISGLCNSRLSSRFGHPRSCSSPLQRRFCLACSIRSSTSGNGQEVNRARVDSHQCDRALDAWQRHELLRDGCDSLRRE